MQDVADLAGVSRITVDRVLNGRGGVGADTERAVLAAAKSLHLDRALNLAPTRLLRIGIVLQNNTNSYYAVLRDSFGLVARQYRRLNLRLSFWYFETFSAEAATRALVRAAAECDALIVVLFEDPALTRKVTDLSRTKPVVTLASDLPDSGRIGYVGANAVQEGQLAAALMGRFLGSPGGSVLIIAGLHRLSEHKQREDGFRATLEREYPNCTVVECFQSFESENIGARFRDVLAKHPDLAGIYNMSIGNGTIAEELRRVGKAGRTVLITHTETPERVQLMREGIVHAVIDRDTYLDARRAIEIQLHAAGRLDAAEISVPQRPHVFLRENVEHPDPAGRV